MNCRITFILRGADVRQRAPDVDRARAAVDGVVDRVQAFVRNDGTLELRQLVQPLVQVVGTSQIG